MNTHIDVTYSGNDGKVTVKPQYQYNQGQQLRVHGIGEDVNVCMHYAVRGLTKPIMRFPSFEEDAWVSFVPNALLAQSSPIVAYVYITSANSAQTIYEIEIPVIKRPMPDGFEMEDDEIADIQQMIAELRAVAEDANEIQAIIDDLRAALREAESLANLSVSAVSLASDQEAYAQLSKDEENNQHIEFGIPAGKQGDEGKPGKDVSHSWNGTVLTITSASGTSSADLKGDSGGITDEQIEAAIDEYLKNNPINGTVTDEQIEDAVNDYLQKNPIDTGIDEEQLNQAVTNALNEAKESGLFDGKDGDPGPQGPKGDSYILTDTDKQEIAEQAADLVEFPIDDTNSSTTTTYSSSKIDALLNDQDKAKVDKNGWTAGKYLGTDENGNVIVMDAIAGGLTSDPQEGGEETPEMQAVPINADQLGGKTLAEILSMSGSNASSVKRLGGKAVFFGDSLQDSNYYDTGKSYVDYIREMNLFDEVVNHSKAGSAFYSYVSQFASPSFREAIDLYADNIRTADYIFIEYGNNDSLYVNGGGSISTVKTRARECIDAVLALNKTAYVALIVPFFDPYLIAKKDSSYRHTREVNKYLSETYNLPVITMVDKTFVAGGNFRINDGAHY